jgi:hypothetical protein
MIRGEDPADRIRKAGKLVARTEARWNAGNLLVVEECAAALEESAAELCAAMTTAIGRPASLRGVKDEICQLKEGVTRIERLSDLAAAFLRGGRQSGCDSPMYSAGGFADTDHSSVATTRIQA